MIKTGRRDEQISTSHRLCPQGGLRASLNDYDDDDDDGDDDVTIIAEIASVTLVGEHKLAKLPRHETNTGTNTRRA